MIDHEDIAAAHDPQGLGDPRITLDQFRAFVAVIDAGGFHPAATILHRSQSAVTQKLSRLEELLGQVLINRKQGHTLSLTEAGRRFLQGARQILHQVDQTVQAAREPGLQGQVRLGMPPDVVRSILPFIRTHMLATYPGLDIRVTSGRSMHLLREYHHQSLDVIAFKVLEPHSLPVPADVLRSEPLVWVAHAMAGIDDWPAVPLATFHEGTVYRTAAINALNDMNRRWKISCAAAEFDNIRVAISEGLGVGVMPLSAVAPGHVILGAEQGFPKLPRVQLAMAARDDADALYARVAALLAEAWRATGEAARSGYDLPPVIA